MREIKYKAILNREHTLRDVYAIDWLNLKVYVSISGCYEWHKYKVLTQYIGVKDKNSEEIYDGYQLKFDPKEWGSEDSMFIVEWDDISAGWIGYGTASDWPLYCEIVGNIYETPSVSKG